MAAVARPHRRVQLGEKRPRDGWTSGGMANTPGGVDMTDRSKAGRCIMCGGVKDPGKGKRYCPPCRALTVACRRVQSGTPPTPEYQQAYYRANEEEIKERSSRWARENRERKNAAVRANPNTPLKQRRKTLRWKYGLEVEDFERLLASQGGRCAICGVTKPKGRHGQWHVDHAHDTNTVRGLLCMLCNMGIGHLGDDPARCEAAAAYLRKPR